MVVKAEVIRKNEPNPQLLLASLTSTKVGQRMSTGGPPAEFATSSASGFCCDLQ